LKIPKIKCDSEDWFAQISIGKTILKKQTLIHNYWRTGSLDNLEAQTLRSSSFFHQTTFSEEIWRPMTAYEMAPLSFFCIDF
jgi:hypothetical protein